MATNYFEEMKPGLDWSDEHGVPEHMKRPPNVFDEQKEFSLKTAFVIVAAMFAIVGLMLGLMFGFHSSTYTY